MAEDNEPEEEEQLIDQTGEKGKENKALDSLTDMSTEKEIDSNKLSKARSRLVPSTHSSDFLRGR